MRREAYPFRSHPLHLVTGWRGWLSHSTHNESAKLWALGGIHLAPRQSQGCHVENSSFSLSFFFDQDIRIFTLKKQSHPETEGSD